ncbi:hypothetical protein P7245_22470 [Vibrio parahaemolyticus]|nr:hypothetical protein [Vibrio parahaemolyticus]
MDYKQLLENVVRPVLKKAGLHSIEAEQQLMGTMAVESGGEYIVQIGSGIARGLFQCEPATHKDIYKNYLVYREKYMEVATGFLTCIELDMMQATDGDSNAMDEFFDFVADNSLIGNLLYQVAICRIHYLRVSDPLPKAGDIQAMAAYWKEHYNTGGGKGDEQHFIDKFPGYLWGL